MVELSRVGDVSLVWGESVRWDDRRQRLYLVDCASQNIHWLERGLPPLNSFHMPSLPTGLALTNDDRLVAALADGLHVVDVDRESIELLSTYPKELGDRANDANADLDGNLVTGTLNVGPGPGSYWWYSSTDGWRMLDDGIGNANGPVVLDLAGGRTLVFADTFAGKLYAYPYDGERGSVGERRVFADATGSNGVPDGACADAKGGIWSCLLGAGVIVRYTSDGVQETIETGVQMPSDVTFGGPELDRMYFVSIAAGGGDGPDGGNAGALMAVDGTGVRGRPETRFTL